MTTMTKMGTLSSSQEDGSVVAPGLHQALLPPGTAGTTRMTLSSRISGARSRTRLAAPHRVRGPNTTIRRIGGPRGVTREAGVLGRRTGRATATLGRSCLRATLAAAAAEGDHGLHPTRGETKMTTSWTTGASSCT